MRETLKKYVFRPRWIKYCSQTLYESLFFCNNMYTITQDEIWKSEGFQLIGKIREIQQDDGGFDIGYEFNFGKIHKTGWSSAPECKMLVALIEYGNLFGFESVSDIIEKGIYWINSNSYQIENDKWVLPYCPKATSEVMVYNGISFALAPLAMYYRYVKPDPKIKQIHDGYINYLYDEFEWDNGYWKYSDQRRTDLNKLQKLKIDNYHLGQQLEMHCHSYLSLPNEKNLKIITNLSRYLIKIYQSDYPNPINYLNYINNDKIGVHLWGYSSLINGYLKYFEISKEPTLIQISEYIFNWINKNAWSDDHYLCIYHAISEKNDNLFYPRSDAWVINNLSRCYLFSPMDFDIRRLEGVYHEIKKQDFSGYENHAATKIGKLLNSKPIQIFLKYFIKNE